MFFIIYFIVMKKLVLSLAVLAGIFMFAGCGNQTTEIVDETTNEVSGEEMTEEVFESTMEDLYKKWGKMTCTMTTNEGGIMMNGTLYIDGKKMRSDVQGSVEGMNIEMKTIIKDGYSYSWSNTSNEGRKVVYDEDEVEEGMNDAATDTDTDSPMTFKCKRGIDGVSFDLPSDIEFKELSY